jgi:O-antigen chain-terminating methyltransferase
VAKSTEEILAEIAAIRQRVSERYPASGRGRVARTAGSREPKGTESPQSPDSPETIPLADLMPLFEARDAADGKAAAIGKVNPRPRGPVNALIQKGKQVIARGLGWFVRDQVGFNAAAVRAFSETLEALNEVNRALAMLAAEQNRLRKELAQTNTSAEELRGEVDSLHAEAEALRAETEALRAEGDAHLREATDNLSSQIRAVAASTEALRGKIDGVERAADAHAAKAAEALAAMRQDAERRVREREREDIRLLRALADFQNASRQQWNLLENELRHAIEARGALAEERAQAAAGAAVEQAVARTEAVLHREIRLLRQRVGAILEQGSPGGRDAAPAVAAKAIAAEAGAFDSLAFSERFRGSEDEVREKLRVYVPSFAGCSPVADLGCGRGEFLDLFREAGGEGIGVESNPELAGIVRAKGHRAVCQDLFPFLAEQQADSLGGILCAHVIEHLPSDGLLRLLREAMRVLRPGGVLALETPNPACLAIFATYFYLDPTHLRPVPAELVQYLLAETGFTEVQIIGMHPAEEEFPELKPLPEPFRQQFYGHLDYGVLAKKPAS